MALLTLLPNSPLGLKGIKPQNFGVNPIPPNSLHNLYSVNGNPHVTWRTISGTGMKPLPSRLDPTDGKDKYGVNYQYKFHEPK